MARFEMLDAGFGDIGNNAQADILFELGMMYATGRDCEVDMVAAHKWFNIAAMRGHREATARRREIAEQMSDSEIGCAQRAARDWLKAHPQAIAPAPMPLRIAA